MLLTLAALGMALYAIYAAGFALFDLIVLSRVAVWASLLKLLCGFVLFVSAAFVRILMPGGLALAIAALLGLQALAVLNAERLYGDVPVVPLFARGVFAAGLVLMAHLGARSPNLSV